MNNKTKTIPEKHLLNIFDDIITPPKKLIIIFQFLKN